MQETAKSAAAFTGSGWDHKEEKVTKGEVKDSVPSSSKMGKGSQIGGK